MLNFQSSYSKAENVLHVIQYKIMKHNAETHKNLCNYTIHYVICCIMLLNAFKTHLNLENLFGSFLNFYPLVEIIDVECSSKIEIRTYREAHKFRHIEIL